MVTDVKPLVIRSSFEVELGAAASLANLGKSVVLKLADLASQVILTSPANHIAFKQVTLEERFSTKELTVTKPITIFDQPFFF